MFAITDEEPTIGEHYGHSRCMLCGNRNVHSLRLAFDCDENGVVRTVFNANPLLQGYDDILHGGIVASLLDSAMTHCLFHRTIKAVTGDLHVRFLEPVGCTASIEIRAWITGMKPPLYILKAECTVDGRVAAWAEAKFMECRHDH